MNVVSKKICLLGDFCVGKTSLIRRFVDGQFSDQYLSTVGVKISRKVVLLPEGKHHVELLIWDIEGHTSFRHVARSYLQGAKAAIIVADVKRQDTIVNVEKHLDLFFTVNPQGWILVAFNKSDLLSPSQLERLVIQYPFEQAQIVETYVTSAKTGEAVDEMFQCIAEKLA
ncbi:Rab family GTPase [Spirulina subsalsa]|uniref:Rab family GTPase n=1 Tax=Spirulina subsalsa TaxID=54311 RepID=UPI0002E420E8|nr:Rab family GTPase [Spirulina subsalsa]